LRALEEMVEIMKRMWTEEKATYKGQYFSVKEAVCEPKPETPPEILIGGGGEKITMGIAAKHADTWNNMAIHQAVLPQKIEALHRRCEEIGRDPASIEISQQCMVVIAEDDDAARLALEKAKKVYGGHMGGAIEEHGIWGTPSGVIEGIERHRALGVSLFVIEFFGRDTREPARLFAEKVAPAFA
ncbi:MAG: LLM class flavin-dependent oxidoreductase, partial [Myxococcota bacterium]